MSGRFGGVMAPMVLALVGLMMMMMVVMLMVMIMMMMVVEMWCSHDINNGDVVVDLQ